MLCFVNPEDTPLCLLFGACECQIVLQLAQRKDYMMVETRPVGPGFWCFVCLVWCWVSLFLSPPSDCSSLPSTMTWAPCPHGVRTRGKKSDHWHLSTALGTAWTGQVIQFVQAHWSFAMCSFFFPLLAPSSKVRAYRMIRMGGTSCGRVQLRCSQLPVEFVLV